MNYFIKILILILFSKNLLLAENFSLNFAFDDSSISIQAVNTVSMYPPLPAPYTQFGLFGSYMCNNSLFSDSDNPVCDQIGIEFGNSNINLSTPSLNDDSSSIASTFNNIIGKTNNMMSNQNSFEVKEADSNGQCAGKCVKNHQPGQLNFYIAQDITFLIGKYNEQTTCSNILLGMQNVAANVEKVWKQQAVTSQIKDAKDELIVGGDCTSSSSSSCQKKTGTTGKTIKKYVQDTEDTIADIKCSGNIWWMSQAESPKRANFGSGLTFYPYQAPDWLGLQNQYFSNAIECSNNYTVFITHYDISSGTGDLDSNQGCSEIHNTFNLIFTKTIQGGYQ